MRRVHGLPPDVGEATADFVARYLSRIGLTPTGIADCDRDDRLLARVVRAQLATIPFENLTIHTGQVVSVAPGVIEDKILGGKRGGICYEVNGLLARGLAGLGFEVTLVGAAVRRDHDEFGPNLGHMAVIAAAGDRQWLVDTGFGGSSVLMEITGQQASAPLDVTTSTGRYRTDGATHRLSEFTDIAHWQSTSPAARFTGSLICSVTDDTHRITMSRAVSEPFVLTRTELSTGDKTRTTVADGAVGAMLERLFGIALETPPTVAEFS